MGGSSSIFQVQFKLRLAVDSNNCRFLTCGHAISMLVSVDEISWANTFDVVMESVKTLMDVWISLVHSSGRIVCNEDIDSRKPAECPNDFLLLKEMWPLWLVLPAPTESSEADAFMLNNSEMKIGDCWVEW